MADAVFSIPLAYSGNTPTNTQRESSPWLLLRDYVASEENQLVPFAVQTLFEHRREFSPLVLTGPSGVGKTYLAGGLAARWKQEGSDRKLVSTTGADFARSFAHALEMDAVAEFRDKHATCQLFVLDDLHQIAGKNAAQHELLLLLDQLMENDVFLLVTANQPVLEIPQLLPGLASRLSEGLIVPVRGPGTAARRVILQQLARFHGVELNSDVLDWIVQHTIDRRDELPTVPLLNHLVLELARAADTRAGALTCDLARDILQDQRVSDRDEPQPTLRLLTALVAKQFGLRASDLRGPQRQQSIVTARGVAIFLARELTNQSLLQLGRHFGNRDHTTILHAFRKTESLAKSDPELRQVIDELRSSIQRPSRGKPVHRQSAGSGRTRSPEQYTDSGR